MFTAYWYYACTGTFHSEDVNVFIVEDLYDLPRLRCNESIRLWI